MGRCLCMSSDDYFMLLFDPHCHLLLLGESRSVVAVVCRFDLFKEYQNFEVSVILRFPNIELPTRFGKDLVLLF